MAKLYTPDELSFTGHNPRQGDSYLLRYKCDNGHKWQDWLTVTRRSEAEDHEEACAECADAEGE